MRAGPTSFSTPLVKMTTAAGTTTAKATFSAPSPVQQSPWHSPIPYLFGGLAAMLGLIAFALLILACSFWKLSGAGDNGGERDMESGSGLADKGDGGSDAQATPVFEEKLLVIMAGHAEPTFLATPIRNKPCLSKGEEDGGGGRDKEREENVKEEDETSRENGDEDDELYSQMNGERSH